MTGQACGITAKIIADSISPAGVRLTTMELNYHRFIHAEFMTHRMFSRNASSSRAIPVEKMVKQATAIPIYWGKNQPGMQAKEEVSHLTNVQRIWSDACFYARGFAESLEMYDVHKQIANRLLEPFQYIKVIVTATEWDNFFKLRLHKDAQPEICLLATCMADVMDESTPVELQPGEWHLPMGIGSSLEDRIKTSVAACARVSFNNHDGSNRSVEKDISLHSILLNNGHMSCFEHQLTPMTMEELDRSQKASSYIGKQAFFRANFNRWTSYRWMIENNINNYIIVG